jgi:hypothetical protein
MNFFSIILNILTKTILRGSFCQFVFNASSIPSEKFSKRLRRHLIIITILKPLSQKFLKKGTPAFSDIK